MQRSSRCQKILIILVLLTLTACNSVFNPRPTPTPFGAFQLSTYFRSLYDQLGGEPVLGQAISPVFPHKDIFCQYTQNVLFCYNPTGKVEADRVSLIAIGTLLAQEEPGQELKIYEGFRATYDGLYGERYVGKPLSEVRYNQEKRRIEQYFEKMGFYQLIDDPRGTVRLMAYGSYACAESCSYQTDTNSSLSGPHFGVDVPFFKSLSRIGGFQVIGFPLSQPYTAADGNLEQVFENALVYVPKDNPATIRLRPLAEIMRTRLEAPSLPSGSQSQGTVFYQVAGNRGFDVPVVFDEYIAAHGGKDISGAPTSDAFSYLVNGENLGAQCFQNYCLYYDPHADAGSQVRLMNLGKQYITEKVPLESWLFEFSPKTTLLKLSEQKPQISASEQQVIHIHVFQVKDLQPISQVSSILVVGMPDGSKETFSVPPTDLKGSSSFTLPPFTNAANGTIIPYVVCLNVPSTSPICQAETFFIWNIK